MTKELQISPDLSVPLDFASETLGILAKKGAGKSNAAVVFAEELHDHGVPWVAIDPKGDWYGIRSSANGSRPGLPVVVFGGKHGDVPLEPTAGALVADLILGDQDRGYLSCVLDVSQFTITDQRRFLLDFGERLFRAKDEERVLHLFLEEAHEYLPQSVPRESARLVSTWQRIVKQGRFKGLGVTIVSQRSAALNKDVLTQVDSLIVLRTLSPQDRAAVKGWVEVHAGASDILRSLHELSPGEAWLWSPEWLDEPTRFRFRQRRTFDSGATPKVGTVRAVPRTLADVDLGAVKEAMAETIEKAKAEDPRALRARIRDLEKRLAVQPEPVIEVPAFTGEDRVAIAELGGQMVGLHMSLTALIERFETFESGLSTKPTPSVTREPSNPSGTTQISSYIVQPSARTSLRGQPSLVPSPEGPNDVRLRTGAHRMVEALGRMHPLRLTKGQWGTVARLRTTGGTWSTYLSDIRRAGLVDENPAGYTLTRAGFDYLGVAPMPMTAHELQEHYRTILRSGAVKMLDALIYSYPRGLTRDEIGAAAEIATTGGTFSTYLSDLIRNGLAVRTGDVIVATDILMRGAEA